MDCIELAKDRGEWKALEICEWLHKCLILKKEAHYMQLVGTRVPDGEQYE
jgi:hypothetical protein